MIGLCKIFAAAMPSSKSKYAFNPKGAEILSASFFGAGAMFLLSVFDETETERELYKLKSCVYSGGIQPLNAFKGAPHNPGKRYNAKVNDAITKNKRVIVICFTSLS